MRIHRKPSATSIVVPASASVSPKGYSSRCSLGFIHFSVDTRVRRRLMASYYVNVNCKYIDEPGKNPPQRTAGTSRPSEGAVGLHFYMDDIRAGEGIRYHAAHHPLLRRPGHRQPRKGRS